MFLGRITGSLVATQKVESMIGQKLLVVEPLRVNEKDQSDLVPDRPHVRRRRHRRRGRRGDRPLCAGIERPLYPGNQTASDRRGRDRHRRSACKSARTPFSVPARPRVAPKQICATVSCAENFPADEPCRKPTDNCRAKQVPFRTIQIVIGALDVRRAVVRGDRLLRRTAAAGGQRAAGLRCRRFCGASARDEPCRASRLRSVKSCRSCRPAVRPVVRFWPWITSTSIRRGSIVRAAMLEGRRFFAASPTSSAGSGGSLATALALIAVIGIFFPTRSRFDDWVREQRELGLAR